jgi:hypothetical protein
MLKPKMLRGHKDLALLQSKLPCMQVHQQPILHPIANPHCLCDILGHAHRPTNTYNRTIVALQSHHCISYHLPKDRTAGLRFWKVCHGHGLECRQTCVEGPPRSWRDWSFWTGLVIGDHIGNGRSISDLKREIDLRHCPEGLDFVFKPREGI